MAIGYTARHNHSHYLDYPHTFRTLPHVSLISQHPLQQGWKSFPWTSVGLHSLTESRVKSGRSREGQREVKRFHGRKEPHLSLLFDTSLCVVLRGITLPVKCWQNCFSHGQLVKTEKARERKSRCFPVVLSTLQTVGKTAENMFTSLPHPDGKKNTTEHQWWKLYVQQ